MRKVQALYPPPPIHSHRHQVTGLPMPRSSLCHSQSFMRPRGYLDQGAAALHVNKCACTNTNGNHRCVCVRSHAGMHVPAHKCWHMQPDIIGVLTCKTRTSCTPTPWVPPARTVHASGVAYVFAGRHTTTNGYRGDSPSSSVSPLGSP